MGMSKHQLVGSLSKKKRLPLKKKSNFLMLTKRQGKVADSQQTNFELGGPPLPKLSKMYCTSICQEYERFKGNLQRNRNGQFHEINEIL